MSSTRPNFNRSMSTEQLVHWLRGSGFGRKDCARLEEERFTAESFLLLDKETCEELGIGKAGQLLVEKLTKEAKEELLKEVEPQKESGLSEETSPAPESPDVMRVEEDHDEFMIKYPFSLLPLCTGPPYDIIDGSGLEGAYQTGAAAAYIVVKKIWKDRDVLRVYFMNPSVLEGWRCEGRKRMTTATILGWASVWENASSAPTFEETDIAEKADIRVKFTAKGGCWSLVGMEASSKTKVPEPTMMLNLSSAEYPEFFLRHLVIHEFGHALGLEHEHQRSDFWDTVKEFIDQEKMESDERFSQYKSKKGRAAFGRDWLAAKPKGESIASEYDSQSIMHYWFAVDWLKNKKYHTRKGITSDPRLSSKQKKYLMGIHVRNNNCARNPSANDIGVLESAYKK